MLTLICLQRYMTPAGKQFEKGDVFQASEDEAEFLVVRLGGEHFAVVPASLAPAAELATNDVPAAPAHMAVEHAPRKRKAR